MNFLKERNFQLPPEYLESLGIKLPSSGLSTSKPGTSRGDDDEASRDVGFNHFFIFKILIPALKIKPQLSYNIFNTNFNIITTNICPY